MKRIYKLAIAIIIIIALCGLSLGITAGFYKLITICFGMTFKFKHAIGIWLIMLAFNLLTHSRKSEKTTREINGSK